MRISKKKFDELRADLGYVQNRLSKQTLDGITAHKRAVVALDESSCRLRSLEDKFDALVYMLGVRFEPTKDREPFMRAVKKDDVS